MEKYLWVSKVQKVQNYVIDNDFFIVGDDNVLAAYTFVQIWQIVSLQQKKSFQLFQSCFC